LKCLLEALEKEKGMVVNEKEASRVVKETGVDTSSQFCVMLTSILESVSDYVTAVNVLEDNLFFEGKFAGSKKKLDVAEGDIFKIFRKFGWYQYPRQHLEQCLEQCLQQYLQQY